MSMSESASPGPLPNPPQVGPATRTVNKRVWYGLTIAGAAVVVAVALFFSGVFAPDQGNPEAAGATKGPSVKTKKLEPRTLRRTTTQPATIHAYHEAKLYARV